MSVLRVLNVAALYWEARQSSSSLANHSSRGESRPGSLFGSDEMYLFASDKAGTRCIFSIQVRPGRDVSKGDSRNSAFPVVM